MFSSDRDELRKTFFTAWRKYLEKQPIEPLEAQVIDVILLHPEYHAILNDPERYQTHDFAEGNPFLHLSLHIALREQISTNRPVGITQVYQSLCEKLSDALAAEHQMLGCLENILWTAQQQGIMPDEKEYLQELKELI